MEEEDNDDSDKGDEEDGAIEDGEEENASKGLIHTDNFCTNQSRDG